MCLIILIRYFTLGFACEGIIHDALFRLMMSHVVSSNAKKKESPPRDGGSRRRHNHVRERRWVWRNVNSAHPDADAGVVDEGARDAVRDNALVVVVKATEASCTT